MDTIYLLTISAAPVGEQTVLAARATLAGAQQAAADHCDAPLGEWSPVENGHTRAFRNGDESSDAYLIDAMTVGD